MLHVEAAATVRLLLSSSGTTTQIPRRTIGVDDYGNDLSEAPINEAPQEQDPLLGLRRGEARRTA